MNITTLAASYALATGARVVVLIANNILLAQRPSEGVSRVSLHDLPRSRYVAHRSALFFSIEILVSVTTRVVLVPEFTIAPSLNIPSQNGMVRAARRLNTSKEIFSFVRTKPCLSFLDGEEHLRENIGRFRSITHEDYARAAFDATSHVPPLAQIIELFNERCELVQRAMLISENVRPLFHCVPILFDGNDGVANFFAKHVCTGLSTERASLRFGNVAGAGTFVRLSVGEAFLPVARATLFIKLAVALAVLRPASTDVLFHFPASIAFERRACLLGLFRHPPRRDDVAPRRVQLIRSLGMNHTWLREVKANDTIDGLIV
jgi:hypothetical protein